VAEEKYREYEGDRLVADASLTMPDSEDVHIELRKLSVTRGLPKDSIERLIKKHMPSINGCFSQSFEKAANALREIVLSLVIDPNGRVAEVHTNKGDWSDKVLERCIVEKLRKLQFPTPSVGRNGVVTLVLVMK